MKTRGHIDHSVTTRGLHPKRCQRPTIPRGPSTPLAHPVFAQPWQIEGPQQGPIRVDQAHRRPPVGQAFQVGPRAIDRIDEPGTRATHDMRSLLSHNGVQREERLQTGHQNGLGLGIRLGHQSIVTFSTPFQLPEASERHGAGLLQKCPNTGKAVIHGPSP